MDPRYTFIDDAASLGVKRLIVLPPEECLSQARRWRVIKPDDFRCRNHQCKGIAIPFQSHQEGPADMGPGSPETVITSRNSIVARRQIGERYRAAQTRVELQALTVSGTIRYHRPPLPPN